MNVDSEEVKKWNAMQENVTFSPEMMKIALDGVGSDERDLCTNVSASVSPVDGQTLKALSVAVKEVDSVSGANNCSVSVREIELKTPSLSYA